MTRTWRRQRRRWWLRWTKHDRNCVCIVCSTDTVFNLPPFNCSLLSSSGIQDDKHLSWHSTQIIWLGIFWQKQTILQVVRFNTTPILQWTCQTSLQPTRQGTFTSEISKLTCSGSGFLLIPLLLQYLFHSRSYLITYTICLLIFWSPAYRFYRQFKLQLETHN